MWFVRSCRGLSTTALVETTQTFGALIIGDFCSIYFGIWRIKGQDILTAGLLGAFQLTATLSILSFLRCVFTKPGFTPYLNPPQVPLAELQFCEHCNQWKPPRTHHCRICGMCIHRVSIKQMDHHCQWINNCVAIKTHKFFLLFLLYFVVAGLMGSGAMAYVSLGYFTGREISWVYLAIDSIGAVLGTFFSLVCLVLLCEQLLNTSRNQVQLEEWQGLTPSSGSLLHNLETVFGTNRWAWLLPIKPALKLDYEEPLLKGNAERFERKTPLCYRAALGIGVALSLISAAAVLCWCGQTYLI